MALWWSKARRRSGQQQETPPSRRRWLDGFLRSQPRWLRVFLLSAGVVTDDRAGTIVLRLTHPDPELLFKLTLPSAWPVPPGMTLRAT